MHLLLSNTIFLKKIGPEMHSDQKFGRTGKGVNYINARKKMFWNAFPASVLLRENFQNNVPACSIIEIPLLLSKKQELA
jgi:hypothetical protein